MDYSTHTLPCGLRIIFLPDDSQVVYCGFELNVGSRQEQASEEGLAHFCEHTTFKGTQRRSSLQILNCLESVGGDLNAFTTKEDTVFYAAILKEHLPRAVDLLSDIVFHSVYPQQEIDKEVEVICDEIESYNDSPAELIYDEFDNLLFRGHPLGHNILGNATRVRQFTTADALRFTKTHYRPDNAVFFARGNINFDHLVRLLEHAFTDYPTTAHPRNAAAAEPCQLKPYTGEQYVVMQRGTHQAHVMMGSRAYNVHATKRMPLYLLNNILGGPGMNARLNLALRERHGLVYTVESTMVCYSDTGSWSVYFGSDPKDVNRCMRLVEHELERMMDKPIAERTLNAAKRQLKGQIGVACDNRENFALDFGKSFLHYGWKRDITSLFNDIDAISAQDVQQVAQDIFNPARMLTLKII